MVLLIAKEAQIRGDEEKTPKWRVVLFGESKYRRRNSDGSWEYIDILKKGLLRAELPDHLK